MLAQGLQLVTVAGLLLVPVLLLPLGAAGLVGAGVALMGAATVSMISRWCERRAWSALPTGAWPAVVPLQADRRFAAAAAVLLGSAGVTVSWLLPVGGGLLAVFFGLSALSSAWDSNRTLTGRAEHPGRCVPALLAATVVCWSAPLICSGGMRAVWLPAGCAAVASLVGWSAGRRTIRPTR